MSIYRLKVAVTGQKTFWLYLDDFDGDEAALRRYATEDLHRAVCDRTPVEEALNYDFISLTPAEKPEPVGDVVDFTVKRKPKPFNPMNKTGNL